MALPAQDYVHSFLRDYTVQLRVGLFASEKDAPQTVIVNVEMEGVDTPRYDDPAENTADRIMDYTQVYRFIGTELTKKPHIPLLETVAEMIVEFCFRDPRVAKVRVRLEKPEVMPDVTVGIEMFRVRSTA